MITIFNRRELTISFSMQKQAEIRTVLRTNKIDYKIKVINRNSPSVFSDSRSRTGTFGQNMSLAYEYIFYVHKDSLDLAMSVIHGI